MPDGVYLRSVVQRGLSVSLAGYAQSNARVSTLMRNIEGSPWLEKPELVEIKLVNMPNAGRTDPPRLNEFTLNFEIRRTPPPSAAGIPAGAPAKQAAAQGGKS
jgi:type IV pilus assembly protein PilN